MASCPPEASLLNAHCDVDGATGEYVLKTAGVQPFEMIGQRLYTGRVAVAQAHTHTHTHTARRRPRLSHMAVTRRLSRTTVTRRRRGDRSSRAAARRCPSLDHCRPRSRTGASSSA